MAFEQDVPAMALRGTARDWPQLPATSREMCAGWDLLELTCPPSGGPPPHTDPSEELLYVLEGEFEFVSPAREGLTARRLQVGDSVCAPQGVPHGYRNVGTQPGLLVLCPQNERVQGFFEELGHPVGPVDLNLLGAAAVRASDRAAAKRWGIGVAGPPPAQ